MNDEEGVKVEMKIEKRIRDREPLSEVLAFRVTKDEATKVKDYAKARGVFMPDVMRSALHTTGVI